MLHGVSNDKYTCKFHPKTGSEDPEEEQRYTSTLPSTSALNGGGWSTPRLGRFTPGNDPVTIVQEAGWAPGPVWTGAENLAPTGIRSPDSPARSESLYRLSYPGRIVGCSSSYSGTVVVTCLLTECH